MGDLEKLVAELRDALAKATPGPWGVDSAYDDDAVYSGGGGCGRGFKNFFIGAEVRGKWATLLDSVNSDEKLIDEEYDEDGKSAWDEIGRNNANFVAIARNNLPALLDALSAKDAEITSLRAEVERMREALGEVAAQNDLSGCADDEIESRARGKLYDCELLARAALGGTDGE